jgi:biliverdin reductase / flavin reductase
MKIVVFGATGRTGRELVEQALASGHEVTAVARQPSRLGRPTDRFQTAQVDLSDAGSIDRCVGGQDVVLSCLGVTGIRASLRPMTFYRDSAAAIVAAMQRNGVRRLVVLSSVGVLRDPTAPIWYRWILKPLLRHKYADMQRMEDVIRSSGLDWVIIRPGRLTDGELTGHYRVGNDGTLPHVGDVTRADVAGLMLRVITTDEFLHRAVAVILRSITHNVMIVRIQAFYRAGPHRFMPSTAINNRLGEGDDVSTVLASKSKCWSSGTPVPNARENHHHESPEASPVTSAAVPSIRQRRPVRIHLDRN